MSADPLKIIEQQLQFLQNRSEKELLTEAETVQLATLIKMKMLLRAKGANISTDDPYEDLSADDLKALLPLLQ